jgi:hypothetical protein
MRAARSRRRSPPATSSIRMLLWWRVSSAARLERRKRSLHEQRAVGSEHRAHHCLGDGCHLLTHKWNRSRDSVRRASRCRRWRNPWGNLPEWSTARASRPCPIRCPSLRPGRPESRSSSGTHPGRPRRRRSTGHRMRTSRIRRSRSHQKSFPRCRRHPHPGNARTGARHRDARAGRRGRKAAAFRQIRSRITSTSIDWNSSGSA